jgi:glycosyltransferase involved in cell wall biosynthesis
MEPITILVPTYNRSRFLPLFLMNLISQDYPHNLLNVIILDDGEERFIKDEDELQRVKEHISPISLTYVTDKKEKLLVKKEIL